MEYSIARNKLPDKVQVRFSLQYISSWNATWTALYKLLIVSLRYLLSSCAVGFASYVRLQTT